MSKSNISDIGILLTNIGSPDEPSTSAVRKYLRKFLSDPRVVELPRWIWWPILYGVILPFRPKKSAQLYQKVWTEKGSPLLSFSQQIADKLQSQLQHPVALGMHYGNPSIPAGLNALREQGVKKILVLPMYPQYSATTTAATFDLVAAALKKWRVIPDIRMIQHYFTDDNYINAICDSIRNSSAKHLMFSFHGIPKRNIDQGDPYAQQCHETVRLITEKLNLTKEQWSLAFQSRLGRAQWLMPYTDKVLAELPGKGISELQVVCPGFAVDCLETLEEIAIRGREQFIEAGGKSFDYIPALNDSEEHLAVLENLIVRYVRNW